MDNFHYKVSAAPSHSQLPESWNSAKNLSKLRMYLYFLFGSFALILLLFIALWGVDNKGITTYYNYLNRYWTLGNSAILSIGIMFVVNLFWIIINLIINYLAFVQEWIPKKKLVLENENSKIKINNWPKDDAEIIERRKAEILENLNFDHKEYEQILKNPSLSPFAFLWLPVKKSYRSLSYLPQKIQNWWSKFRLWLKNGLEDWQEFLSNLGELILFLLNPFNIWDEIVDFLVTLLVRFFYPMLLTPIIFFLPIKMEYVFGNINFVLEILSYFLIIGGLRVGVAFFCIYLRFLRNSRAG